MPSDTNADTRGRASESMPVYGNRFPDAFSKPAPGCGKVTVPEIKVLDLCRWEPSIPDPETAVPSRQPVITPTVPVFADSCIYIEPKVNVEYTDRTKNKSTFTTDKDHYHSDCTDGRYVMNIDVPVKCPIPDTVGTGEKVPKFFEYGGEPASSISVVKKKNECSIEDIQVDVSVPCVYSELKGAVSATKSRVRQSFDAPEEQNAIVVSGSSDGDTCSLNGLKLNLVVPKGCMNTRLSGKAAVSFVVGEAGEGMPTEDGPTDVIPYKDVDFEVHSDESCGFDLSVPIEVPIPSVCKTSFDSTVESLEAGESPYAYITKDRTGPATSCEDKYVLNLGIPRSCTPNLLINEVKVEETECAKPMFHIKSGGKMGVGPCELLSGKLDEWIDRVNDAIDKIHDIIGWKRMPDLLEREEHLRMEREIVRESKKKKYLVDNWLSEQKARRKRLKINLDKENDEEDKVPEEERCETELYNDMRAERTAKECSTILCAIDTGAEGTDDKGNKITTVQRFSGWPGYNWGSGWKYFDTYSGPKVMYQVIMQVLGESGCQRCGNDISLDVYLSLPKVSRECPVIEASSADGSSYTTEDAEGTKTYSFISGISFDGSSFKYTTMEMVFVDGFYCGMRQGEPKVLFNTARC